MEQSKGKTHMDYLNPKPHLRTSDILDKEITYTIKGHGRKQVYDKATRGEVKKGIVYFPETPKYLIVNPTQIEQIARVANSEFLEDWVGVKIVLFVEEVKVGRGKEDAIRIKAPVASQNGKPSVSQNGNTAENDPQKQARVEMNEIWQKHASHLSKEEIKNIVSQCAGDYVKARDVLKEQHVPDGETK